MNDEGHVGCKHEMINPTNVYIFSQCCFLFLFLLSFSSAASAAAGCCVVKAQEAP